MGQLQELTEAGDLGNDRAVESTAPSGSGRFLQFGPGPNLLPEPWENLDPSHDIAKPLRFPDGSARYIVAEHVIEHVPFLQGLGFLAECYRVLEPGGVLRVSFPDVTRLHMGRWEQWIAALPLEQRERPGWNRAAVYRQLLTGWGHKACWTADGALCCLVAAGFGVSRIEPQFYSSSGQAALCDIESPHRDGGRKVAELETTILEATK